MGVLLGVLVGVTLAVDAAIAGCGAAPCPLVGPPDRAAGSGAGR